MSSLENGQATIEMVDTQISSKNTQELPPHLEVVKGRLAEYLQQLEQKAPSLEKLANSPQEPWNKHQLKAHLDRTNEDIQTIRQYLASSQSNGRSYMTTEEA